MKIHKATTKWHWIFLFFWLITLAASTQADTNKTYRLSTEDDLENRYINYIEPYWKNHGERGSLKAEDDLTLSFIKFEIDNEKGAIVISSGRTESYLKYQELVYDLTQNGYSVYMHDHRGQGFSERILKEDPHKGHVDSFDDYVNDLDLFINKVVLSKPHEKLYLLAHSMGGGIATRYIEKYPDVFNAAALSSPMHAPNAKILVSPEGGCLWFRATDWVCKDCYAGFKAKPYTPKPFDNNEYTHSKKRYARLLKIYSENSEIQLGGPTRGWAGQACAASKDMQKDAEHIKIPVLVLQASKDSAVTPEGQEEFCRILKEKTGISCDGNKGDKPIIIEGAYHELFIENDKYRIDAITRILEFFEHN
ncbi:MAG: alpha/beta fold hydrolase [Desulfobacterales bacterium]|nr:alpha/beta fold hydrolase [Desulfobacterales bacterium]